MPRIDSTAFSSSSPAKPATIGSLIPLTMKLTGLYSATEAACLSAAHCLRAELRPGGVKVVNVFSGPLDTEWFQTVPPPKIAPAVLARAVIDALRRGMEDVFVGDIAEDIRQRLAVNPKALEREMSG